MTQTPQDKWEPWNRPYVVAADPVYCRICLLVIPETEIKEHIKDCHELEDKK